MRQRLDIIDLWPPGETDFEPLLPLGSRGLDPLIRRQQGSEFEAVLLTAVGRREGEHIQTTTASKRRKSAAPTAYLLYANLQVSIIALLCLSQTKQNHNKNMYATRYTILCLMILQRPFCSPILLWF